MYSVTCKTSLRVNKNKINSQAHIFEKIITRNCQKKKEGARLYIEKVIGMSNSVVKKEFTAKKNTVKFLKYQK